MKAPVVLILQVQQAQTAAAVNSSYRNTVRVA